MKRLAAVAVIVACFGLSAAAQRATAHGGGFSGSHGGSVTHSAPGFHGGISGSHGFSGPRAGPPIHSAPPFHGGIKSPDRIASPPRYGINRSPIQLRPSAPSHFSTRQPYNGSMRRNPNNFAGRQPSADPMHHRRMPYHSPYGRDHRRSFYSWGSFPLWSAWGYPYLLPSYLDYPGYDYNSQSGDNYASNQGSSSGPYEPQPEPDQYEPESPPAYTPWPYGSPAPGASQSAVVDSLPAESPITLVCKDGRPSEQVRNYLLTSSTLTVLDQHRRDIPIEQLDLTATAKANRAAGVDFALPGGGR